MPDPPLQPTQRGRRGRRRVPTILQMEATECGAACLAMVLGHHGLWVPLERLRVECGVSRDGSKAANILRAARGHGMVAKGYRKDAERVAELPFPMIIHWNFNHFVVLEGIDRRTGEAWINDPGSGPRHVPAEEFDESFTGICLAMQRGPAFRRGGAPPSLVGGLRTRLRGAGTALSFLMLVNLTIAIPGIAVPVLTQVFVDDVLVKERAEWVPPLLLGLLLGALLAGGLAALRHLYLARMEVKLATAHGAVMLWHILRLPVEFFAQRFPGDVAHRMESNDSVAKVVSEQLTTAAGGLFTLLFFAAVMALYDPLLAAVAAGLSLGNLVALRLSWRLQDELSRRLLREEGNLQAVASSGLASIETIKASGAENDFFARWGGLQANYLNVRQRVALLNALLATVPVVLSALVTVTILWIGGHRVMDGVLTVGELVAFQGLVGHFTEPLAVLMRLGGAVNAAKGDMARLDDVGRYPADPRIAERMVAEEAAAPRLSGRIEVRNLVFGYNRREPPLLDGISFDVAPGQRVALVGGSGSGKSTLAKLLVALYRPWSGRILLDGRDLHDIPAPLLAGSVASVDQEIVLFEGTLRDNLTFWDTDVPERTVIRALEDAEMLPIVAARPRRYDSHVEEGGANFSGGQRQRLEIARALVGNPSILVLDEATSALDPVVEHRIDANLRRRGCTCVVVAHRLSTIRDSDVIIMLDRGRIVQQGDHDTLAAVDGPYRRLIDAEAGRVSR
jgi:NHLM bacteriocin system ABC transporter peptidase/ATP-binding protein